jgi:segregation and condensation protein A
MQRMKNKPELKIVVSNTPEAPAVEPPPEQVEMPFAIVNGEPVTQMPRDLYIPPQAMEVFLEAFEGPLDLLLYLIRRQNLNILDIPLAEITRQYMKYIEVMTELQLELAGEYMVMAATLAEIKSRMLLPRPKVAQDGNEEDPRAELVRRLQEYERFKRAAEGIDALHRLERDVWPTSAELKDRKIVRLLPQVTLQEMLLAFKDVVVRSEMFAHHHIQRERLSVRARMADILSTLEHSSFVEFIRLFRPEEGRMGITVTFVAILELVREGLIDIVQAEPFAPLHVRSAGVNRKLHVVAGNDVPGAEGEQVFADEVAVVGEPVLDGVAAIAGGSAAAMLADTIDLSDDADFDDDDDDEDLEEDLLEGVDDEVLGGENFAADASAETDDPAPAAERVVGEVSAGNIEPAMTDDVVLTFEQPAPDEITVTFEPSLADVTAAVDVTSDTVTVGPSVPGGMSVAVEPALSGDEPLDEQASFDAEYAGPADEVASAEHAALDESEDEVSLIGETSVAGEVSLVGDESLSGGGPVVEVDEFTFDVLPALDEVGQADQQPAVGEQTGVKKFAGTDEPPSPGEESDE